MIGRQNDNPTFPLFMEDNQFCYDSGLPPIHMQLYNNFPGGINVKPVSSIGKDGISLHGRPWKRSREADDTARQQTCQFSLNNFHHDEADLPAKKSSINAVSTGLRLSYDDDERNSSVTLASASTHEHPTIMSLSDNLRTEIDRQMEEFDHYIKVQEECFAKGVREMEERHMASFLATMEKGINRRLKEKEAEIENMNKKNEELADRIKQLAVEAQSWHYRARYNESVVNVLRSNLNNVMVQGAEQCKEGYGDSEEDAVSSAVPNMIIASILPKPNEMSKQNMISCRACQRNEACMLLLPCRHLCLCRDCEGFIESCPVCHSRKTAGFQVYMT